VLRGTRTSWKTAISERLPSSEAREKSESGEMGCREAGSRYVGEDGEWDDGSSEGEGHLLYETNRLFESDAFLSMT